MVDGTVWGRGSVDMLNITATMAVTVRHLAMGGFRPRGSLIYLAAADEEALRQTYGVPLPDEPPSRSDQDRLRGDGRGRGPAPEPVRAQSSSLAVGEKGSNWRRVIVRGTPGHGSMPYGSDNALITAAEVVRRIAAYRPKTTILDVWRRYVASLDLDPALAAALVDPERVLEAATQMEVPGFARIAHACTHTTFSPNLDPRRDEGERRTALSGRSEVDIRSLPGVSPTEVDAMLAEAIGDLAGRVEVQAQCADEGSITSSDTPPAHALARCAWPR